MKRAVLFTFLMAFAGTYLNAQDDIIIGAKGGLNIANVSGESNPAKFVPHAGAFFQFPINETFLIVPEVLVSWQGHGKEEFSPGFSSKLNLTYINVPVTFRYNITYNIHAFAGPQVGFLMSANTVTDFSGDSQKTNVKDFWNTTDFGLMFGAGMAFMDQFQVYLRYVVGLSNGDASDLTTRKNNVLQLGLGVNLHRIDR